MPMLPGSVRVAQVADGPFRRESHFAIPGLAAGLLLLGWAAVAGFSLLLDTAFSSRFLDLPLGAFLAGQGTLIGLVIVGVRFARSENPDDEA